LTTREVFAAIQGNGLVRLITKSDHLVIAGFQIVHVFGIVLLLTSLILMSLRLLGWVLRQQSIPQITNEAARLFWAGLWLTVLSGVLMLVTGIEHYFYNRAFDVKMLLLSAAVVIQLALFRKVAARESPRPILTRATVAVSLVLWFGVAVSGRAIGFV
jgi:hypothetical protein